MNGDRRPFMGSMLMSTATRLRPTYWQAARIWPPCNACWAMRVSRPPCPTSTSRNIIWLLQGRPWSTYQT